MATPSYSTSLFIFRRDLRIHDNTGLLQALSQSVKLLPCFIFDPRQIQPHPYQSRPALQFMRQSLHDLNQALQQTGTQLSVYEGLPVEVIELLTLQYEIQAVFVNRDYTPFSRRRDDEIAQCCRKLNLDFVSCPDALLTEPEYLLKADSKPYKVFTAFHNVAKTHAVHLPEVNKYRNFMAAENNPELNIDAPFYTSMLTQSSLCGGREQGLAILADLDEQANYLSSRDIPALNSTTKLSAHLKFGTLSVREIYVAIKSTLGDDHPLLRQLYWRDFFTHIGFHFPHVFGKAFHSRYDSLQWDNNREFFQRWCDGLTGFPIVDAGMRELNATGFMHNRTRMIVASFLVKDLHISWRWGERYFAQRLVDYDPAVNNGNWQWAASTGCDAQPYFRIFNPWLQQVKFDPDCIYIKRWVPELKDIPIVNIHAWYDKYTSTCSYPAAMVEHAAESKLAKERYFRVAKS